MIRFTILLFCIGIILCDAEPGDAIYEYFFNILSKYVRIVGFFFIIEILENVVIKSWSEVGNKKVGHSEEKTKDPNDEKLLAKILELNETVNSQDSQGYTALHRAAKLGSVSNKIQTIEIKQTNQMKKLLYFIMFI